MAQVEPRIRRGLSDLSERALAFWLLTPAALLLGLVALYPVGRLFYTSLFRRRLTDETGNNPVFVGFENFAQAFADERFWTALWNTVLIVLVTVPGALVVGLLLALLANLPFRVKWPVRLGLLLPWALPLVFAGLIFRWFFDSQYGVVNDVIVRLGGDRLLWVTTPELLFLGRLPEHHLEEQFLCGAYFTGRFAGHSQGALRGSSGGWGQPLAELLAHHPAASATGHPGGGNFSHHCSFSDLRYPLCYAERG
jgi:hypothetical protein